MKNEVRILEMLLFLAVLFLFIEIALAWLGRL